jgi:hypothetical protein
MKVFYSLIFLFLYAPVINAQRADVAINNYVTQFPSEIVYLQFDNSMYAAGYTVWFKAYITANISPSSFSKSLYVDWYDEEGNAIAQQVYPMLSGAAYGQFPVPAGYTENKIHVLAYTRWMLNDNDSFLFHKDIRILNGNSEKRSIARKEISSKIQLQFFPEGGNLISGLRNKIAFKAADNYGNPVQVTGMIKDSKENIITSFSSVHDGMGFFYLDPKNNESYKAESQTEQGVFSSVSLPKVQPSGVAMEMQIEKGRRKIIIRKNREGLKQVHLLVTMNGLVDYLSNINLLVQDSVVVKVPVNDVPSGILTFTVLDEQWNPLAERISFIKNIQPSLPAISVIKKDLTKRGYNIIDLHYEDSTLADFSVAVTDADIPADSSSNIISYLLLAGQLKGRVNNAGYYFSDTTLQLQKQLDLVMMTNGWRTYQWKAIVSGKQPLFRYAADRNYFFLSGGLLHQRKLPKGISFLIKSREELAGYTFPVKANGSFCDSSMFLFGNVLLSYQSKSKRGDIPVRFDTLWPPAFSTYPFKESSGIGKPGSGSFTGAQGNANEYYFPLGNTLATVKVYAAPKTAMDKTEDKYASQTFKNENGYRLSLEDNPTLYNNTSVMDMLIARIPNFNSNPANPPYFFVDEVEQPLDAVNQLPLSLIAFVKYYPRNFILSPGAGGRKGTVAIYTKKFSPEELRQSNHEGSYQITGYTIAKEFYSPDYSNAAADSITDDRRKTIFWEPSLSLGRDHKNASISFYNSNYAKRFRVIVEGMNSNGALIHKEIIVE